MSVEYMRRVYGVPIKRGRRVRIEGYGEGVITSAREYLWVRLDGQRRPVPFHPTWGVTYLPDSEVKP